VLSQSDMLSRCPIWMPEVLGWRRNSASNWPLELSVSNEYLERLNLDWLIILGVLSVATNPDI
jgi:hypothetical protein